MMRASRVPAPTCNSTPAIPGRAFEDAHVLGAQYAVSSIMRSLVLGAKRAQSALKTGMSLDEAKRTGGPCQPAR